MFKIFFYATFNVIFDYSIFSKLKNTAPVEGGIFQIYLLKGLGPPKDWRFSR